MSEENLFQEAWDKKKIFIGLAALILIISLGFGAKVFVLDKNKNLNGVFKENKVKGSTTENKEDGSSSKDELQSKPLSLPSTDNLKTEAENKLEVIKQEINNISITELASSSPQIRKILDDIKSLEQYPRNQAKDICEEICKGL